MPTSGDRNDSNKPMPQPKTAKEIERNLKDAAFKK